MLPSSGQQWNSSYICNSLSHQVCGRWGARFVSHGHELGPVATKALRVNAGVHDESPVGAASSFLSQSCSCLTLRHIVADVDDLHDQQVKQPDGHDTAVPRTGETKCRAGEQRGKVFNHNIKHSKKHCTGQTYAPCDLSLDTSTCISKEVFLTYWADQGMAAIHRSSFESLL